MLVLSRRQNERIRIVVPPSTEETVIEVMLVKASSRNSTNTRLGFEADRDVIIHRSEVWDAIHGEGA